MAYSKYRKDHSQVSYLDCSALSVISREVAMSHNAQQNQRVDRQRVKPLSIIWGVAVLFIWLAKSITDELTPQIMILLLNDPFSPIYLMVIMICVPLIFMLLISALLI